MLFYITLVMAVIGAMLVVLAIILPPETLRKILGKNKNNNLKK